MMMVSGFSHPVSVASMMLAVALALSACGTTGKGTGPASLGGGSTAQKPETSLLTPLGNGLLGNSANQLNAADRKKALEAEYRALEYSPAGKAVSRSGSGSNSGDVTAAQPYQVGSQNCRQYSHSFTVDGSQQTSRGTACRNPDGSWTPLT
ncbi:hypothetical protein HED63_03250 [Ochrobactrum cytisi]|nr:hypothetical protein [Brucella cytisi]